MTESNHGKLTFAHMWGKHITNTCHGIKLRNFKPLGWCGLGICLLLACQSEQPSTYLEPPLPTDPHSFAQPNDRVIEHLDLELLVDFDRQVIQGKATFHLQTSPDQDTVILDTRALAISRVSTGHEGALSEVAFRLDDHADAIMGQPLTVVVPPGQTRLVVDYETAEDSDALIWLNDPTHGRFLITDSGPTTARAWFPCQDSPSKRFTYSAQVHVPNEMKALMNGDNSPDASAGSQSFSMRQPIPAYLIALAVGNWHFESLGAGTGVYAPPSAVPDLVARSSAVERILEISERTFGPYPWTKLDLLILPPSFPKSASQTPQLACISPIKPGGDGLLASAGWGHLLTPATWEDYWIGASLSLYIERRITEEIHDRNYAGMLAALGYENLRRSLSQQEDTTLTRLKPDLKDRDPNLAASEIAAEKGYLLLRHLEDQVGRNAWDQYVKKFLSDFSFEPISTEQWKKHVQWYLLDSLGATFNLEEWIHQPGLPTVHQPTYSPRLASVDRLTKTFIDLGRLDVSATRAWNTQEWLRFIRSLPANLHRSFYAKIDDVYKLSEVADWEILAAWLELRLRSKTISQDELRRLTVLLQEVGLESFVAPLYQALIDSDRQDLAAASFANAKSHYHSITSNSVEQLLSQK